VSVRPLRFWVEPLEGEEGVGAGDERAVVMEAEVASAFVVVEPELALELAVVELDLPGQPGESGESARNCCTDSYRAGDSPSRNSVGCRLLRPPCSTNPRTYKSAFSRCRTCASGRTASSTKASNRSRGSLATIPTIAASIPLLLQR